MSQLAVGWHRFASGRTILFVQYWRDFEHLERFARAPEERHLPAWRAFNRHVGDSGDVGIFHETYLVPAGAAEAIYGNMPVFGLAKATRSVPVTRRGQAAAFRLGRRPVDDLAAPAHA